MVSKSHIIQQYLHIQFSALFNKPKVEIIIDEVAKRKRQRILELNGDINRLPTLQDMENVTGKVIISLTGGKRIEHKGIKIELLGIIQGTRDAKDTLKFISLTQDLESPGMLMNDVNTYNFSFQHVQKAYETYRGLAKGVKYLLRLTIDTTLKTLTYDQEFAVINPVDRSALTVENKPIKLEVGIDEWLHLIFEMDQRNFGLKDICTGKVTFKRANIKLKSMEIQIIKKEIINVTGVAPETTVITKYEIMDGGPVKNETVPIRFFLKPYDLTPTMVNVNNKFSVQYFINLVLSDDVDRKYFKQHEIGLFRLKKEKKEPSKQIGGSGSSMPETIIEETKLD